MIGAIRYVNSIGEEIAFGEGCWHYGKTDIFDTSCAHRSIGGRITGFERNIREMSLTVELAGPEEERRRLADVTSYDVRTGQPGTLWADGCSMRCWIPGAALSDWYQLEDRLTAELTVVSDDPVWVRSASVTLESRDDLVVGGLDYPHDYPHDYLYSAGASVVMENPFRLPAKCDIYIPGPCSDPYVIIAGNRYQVLGDVDKGQLLIIKGLRGPRDRRAPLRRHRAQRVRQARDRGRGAALRGDTRGALRGLVVGLLQRGGGHVRGEDKPVVDVIWADRFGREKGYVGKVAGDFTIGTENTFALKVESSAGISQDCYLMIDGHRVRRHRGRRGDRHLGRLRDRIRAHLARLLASRLVVPDAGQLHHTVSGDLNAVLGELVQRLGLWERMAAEESASGMSVSAWEFSRASADMDAYTGIRAMLRSAGAKLRIRYDSALRKAVLSAVPRGDYTSDGLDGERVDFILRRTRPVNHLHCLGTGEGLERVVVDLYADRAGNVSKTQTITGMALREEVFESSSAEAAELEEDGTQAPREMQEEMSECGLKGADDRPVRH